jgi:hypothetical protein
LIVLSVRYPTPDANNSRFGGMAEIRTVTTLRKKGDQICRTIPDYEKKLDQARTNLAHIAAAISIFEAKGGERSHPFSQGSCRAFNIDHLSLSEGNGGTESTLRPVSFRGAANIHPASLGSALDGRALEAADFLSTPRMAVREYYNVRLSRFVGRRLNSRAPVGQT